MRKKYKHHKNKKAKKVEKTEDKKEEKKIDLNTQDKQILATANMVA